MDTFDLLDFSADEFKRGKNSHQVHDEIRAFEKMKLTEELIRVLI